MSWDFLAPGRLWLLLAVAGLVAAYVVAQFSRQRHVIDFTNVELLEQLAPDRPEWRRHVVSTLAMLAMAIGVVAMAQPFQKKLIPGESNGRIVFAFDVSLSMEATDVEPNRIEAARAAALDFVEQVDEGVELGLLSFSGTVTVKSQPTLNHAEIRDEIERLRLGEGTAIGDALIEGTQIVTDGADPEDEQTNDDGPTGAIVLLTDGETTVGKPTSEGSAAAAAAGVPVYAIAFGTASGTVTDPITGEIVPVPVNLDQLMAVADETSGQFFAAPTIDDFRDAYGQISENLNEGVTEPTEEIVEITWRYVAAALLCFAVAWLLGLWWLRSLL